jgi:hypothetical protein
MKVIAYSNKVWVVKEEGEKRAKNDSQFMYRVKNELNRMHYDTVKKLMYKDGHMVSDTVYYIRDRRGRFCVWDDQYQIRSAAERFNRDGQVHLSWYEL